MLLFTLIMALIALAATLILHTPVVAVAMLTGLGLGSGFAIANRIAYACTNQGESRTTLGNVSDRLYDAQKALERQLHSFWEQLLSMMEYLRTRFSAPQPQEA